MEGEPGGSPDIDTPRRLADPSFRAAMEGEPGGSPDSAAPIPPQAANPRRNGGGAGRLPGQLVFHLTQAGQLAAMEGEPGGSPDHNQTGRRPSP